MVDALRARLEEQRNVHPHEPARLVAHEPRPLFSHEGVHDGVEPLEGFGPRRALEMRELGAQFRAVDCAVFAEDVTERRRHGRDGRAAFCIEPPHALVGVVERDAVDCLQ